VVVICRLSATENTCLCFVPSARTVLVHNVGCLRRNGQSRRQRRIDSVGSFDLTFIFIKSKMMTIECIEYMYTHTNTEWAKSRYTEDAILYTVYLLLAHSIYI